MTPKAYVLMTAMPPTKGHLHLIDFASGLSDHVEVILCTQPGEPFVAERNYAIGEAVRKYPNVHLNLIHKTLPQEPEGNEGFWDLWTDFLYMFGFKRGDYIVASEKYGNQLAAEAGGIFMPYDIGRELYLSKATEVRHRPRPLFAQILPEFQPVLRKTVTLFGAESTGKTTLSKNLAHTVNGHWLFEYARPYLENTTNEITERSMTAIWKGQCALQRHGLTLVDRPFIVQDTDLWTTVGYWDYWAGNTPNGLINDAVALKSDLYLITKSNIPFEADPLRYGGDKREASDEYWIECADRFNLNYRVLHATDLYDRIDEASSYMLECFNETARTLNYQREGAEYVH